MCEQIIHHSETVVAIVTSAGGMVKL